MEKSQVNIYYTGLAENEWGWWYVENGQINFGYTGFAENEWGIWYVELGYITFAYNGTINDGGRVYTIVNSKVESVV